MLSVLKSRYSVAGAFIASFIINTSKDPDPTNKPFTMIWVPVVAGGFIGGLITKFSPLSMRPYLVVSTLALGMGTKLVNHSLLLTSSKSQNTFDSNTKSEIINQQVSEPTSSQSEPTFEIINSMTHPLSVSDDSTLNSKESETISPVEIKLDDNVSLPTPRKPEFPVENEKPTQSFSSFFNLFGLPEPPNSVRINFTSHEMLENKGPVIRITGPISIPSIEKALCEYSVITNPLDPNVLSSLDKIKDALHSMDGPELQNYDAVFICNKYWGLVKIITTDDIQYTICVKI